MAGNRRGFPRFTVSTGGRAARLSLSTSPSRSDEDAVERGHPRLAALVHGRERDVLRSLQVADDLPGGQAPLRLDDVREMRVRPREGAIEQRLELPYLVLGLEHRLA